jgi:hypothetical protein
LMKGLWWIGSGRSRRGRRRMLFRCLTTDERAEHFAVSNSNHQYASTEHLIILPLQELSSTPSDTISPGGVRETPGHTDGSVHIPTLPLFLPFPFLSFPFLSCLSFPALSTLSRSDIESTHFIFPIMFSIQYPHLPYYSVGL